MNNPPAFPQFVLSNGGAYVEGGMTLRDYFAAKSMQAMETRSASGTYHGRAIQAYAQADAMLKAREE
jgi:S-adenosylmethionine hydrolase